ncbi:MAG: peptidoglycan DD-metalloendopeptidase family protein [Burkholderiales bacterium]|jgi:lipoprotein NlpD|uniref:peptidoglycan DD-metalloendopeptidase family protein n=1 Tax=Limnobacter sp. TaxID=2003368 RepID=UPI0039554CEB|nr:peptidoglycan DD-metalloendopeptidase family protein [Burkholderiales bacterium]
MKRGVSIQTPWLGNTRTLAVGFATLTLLAACTSTGNQAPVIDRLPSRSTDSAVGADGIYTVKAGDTLYSIALDNGMDWRELARMNNLADPSKIIVGQKLRVTGAPGAAASSPSSGTVVEDTGVEVTPITPAGGAKPVEATPVPEIKPPAPVAVTLGFIWPHPGDIIQGYKAGVNKGIDIAAKVGDPVLASQAGRVVYSGNALRGYGNLIILKHDNNLLTAYAHNKTLLVKEGEPVTKGQKIAEAGQSDTDRPKLHFEVRKQGKPVDPMDYLPAR